MANHSHGNIRSDYRFMFWYNFRSIHLRAFPADAVVPAVKKQAVLINQKKSTDNSIIQS